MVNNIVLGPIIGAVTDEYAKIWFFGEWEKGKKPECRVYPKGSAKPIKGSPFKFKELHADLHDYNNLRGKSYLAKIKFPPGKNDEFVFQINTDESPERTFKLKRAPKKGDVDFSFGLISCHNALKDGYRDCVTEKMWKFMYKKLKWHHSSFLIQCGDQVYCDEMTDAWEKSLHSRNNKEKLNYYRDTYLQSWGFNDVQNVLSTFPQLMIWDDHEITNGWGSKIKHNADPVCRDVFRVAKQVYNEFQHSHNPEPMKKDKFYYGYYYGNAAFLVMDLRGERKTAKKHINHFTRPFKKTDAMKLYGKILSEEQWKDLEKWLASSDTKKSKVLFVVSSVPVIHLNRELGSLGWLKNDIMDQWSVDQHKRERRRLLKDILTWMDSDGKQTKPAVILSGDVHVGTEATICTTKDGKDKIIFQYTSSPITNIPSALLDKILEIFKKPITFHLNKQRTISVEAVITKKYRRRNFGIIRVRYKNGVPNIIFRMYRRGHKKPARTDFNYNPDLKRHEVVNP